MAKITDIDYRVRFGFDSGDVPLSIIRMISGPDVFEIEYCNEESGWKPAPDLISCFIGSIDGGYGQAPDAEPANQEFIDSWVLKWSKNWDE